MFIITPFLLVGDLVLGKYSLLFFNREFPYILVRNWLFVGIPYFSIGIWLRENNNFIQAKLKNRGRQKLVLLIILTVITTLSERFILVSLHLNAARDHYISTTFLATAVFLYFVLYVSQKENVISLLGKNDSGWIYILHPIFITLMASLVKRIGMDRIYLYIQPILVFLITAAFIELINYKKITRKEENFQMQEKYEPHKSTRYNNKKENTNIKSLPELYENRENCCGCTACYAVCPVKAITMEPDEEGFLYPVVDAGKCVRCYRCIAVCAFKVDQKARGYLV